MLVLPSFSDARVHANTIVFDPNGEVFVETDLDGQPASHRVGASVADGLAADAKDLITNDWMCFLRIADY